MPSAEDRSTRAGDTARIWGTVLGLAVVLGVFFWWLGGWVSQESVLAWDRAGILLGYLLACLGSAGGLVTLLRRREIRRWLERLAFRHFRSVGEPFHFPAQVEAIVIPVSRYEQPAWILHQLQPRYAALLVSQEKRNDARQIVQDFQDRVVFEPDIEEMERRGWILADGYDPRDAKDLTGRFLDRFRALGVARGRTFVDTTGGTVPMSLGVFQAAEEAGVSSLYVRGRAPKDEGGEAIFIVDPADPKHGEPVFLSDRTGREERNLQGMQRR